jgi:pilus assembly protein CpaB
MKKIYIFAIAAAVITAVLLYIYLSSLRQMAEVQYEEVVVANANIPAYTVITADMLDTTEMPLESAHPLAIKNKADAIGKVCDGTVLAGEVLLSGSLKSIGESNDNLAYLVEDGMRAVSVLVDDVTGVAGYIHNNDHVDVLVTIDVRDSQNGNSAKTITTLVAENIQVLAAGATIADTLTEDGATSIEYTTVTLLADPETARRIVFAAQEGRVTLILRSVTDESTPGGSSIDRYDVEGW